MAPRPLCGTPIKTQTWWLSEGGPAELAAGSTFGSGYSELLLIPGTFSSLAALGGNPFCANMYLTLETAKNSLLCVYLLPAL